MSKSKEFKKNLKKIQPNSGFINYKLISCSKSENNDTLAKTKEQVDLLIEFLRSI